MSDIFLPRNTLITVSLILFALIIASIIVYRKHTADSEKHRELVLRTQSWWWMIALIVCALALGVKVTIIFFGFISFLALKEFYSIIPIRHVDRRLVFWAYLSIIVQYYMAYIDWYGVFIIFIPVYMFLFIPMRAVLMGETEGFIKANATIQWSLMLCVFAFSHIVFLINLRLAQNPNAGYAGLILLLILMTQFNDVCQYVCGKSFGKRKIIPKVSPNKTWGGFLGGFILTTLLGGILAPFLSAMSHMQGLGAGIIISISGFIGDVVISSVKRDLQIKDSGSLIPGHGGLLDRIDSLMYSAPLFFHYLYYIYY